MTLLVRGLVRFPRGAPAPARRAGGAIAAPRRGRSAVTVVAGLPAWMLFAFHLHQPLFGAQPIPWH